MTSYYIYTATMSLSCTVLEKNGDFSQKSQILHTHSVFNATTEGVPLGIEYQRWLSEN